MVPKEFIKNIKKWKHLLPLKKILVAFNIENGNKHYRFAR
jgi:hypothetical protein